MKAKEISNLLGMDVNQVEIIINPEDVISKLTTPAEAKALYQECPRSMKSAVVKKWEELAIPLLTTPAEAKALYQECPRSMEPAVIKVLAKM